MATEGTARKQRRSLTRADVLSAAERIVDEYGWDGLTMATLALNLGIRAPSLYHHVANLDEIRALSQARTLSGLGAALAEATDGQRGRDGLVAVARAHRAFALSMPHRYLGFGRTPIDQDVLDVAGAAAIEVVHGVLRSVGVPDAMLEEVSLMMFISIHGAITVELSDYFPEGTRYDVLFDGVVDSSIQAIEDAVARAATRGAGQ